MTARTHSFSERVELALRVLVAQDKEATERDRSRELLIIALSGHHTALRRRDALFYNPASETPHTATPLSPDQVAIDRVAGEILSDYSRRERQTTNAPL